MRLGKDIEGKPIISLTDGRILGRSKDLYIDAGLESLAGLYLGSTGVIRRKSSVIPREDVNLFGIDVILVKKTDVITDDKERPEARDWIRLKDLQGKQVRTPGGTKLGVVGDVVLDEVGNIVGFSLSRVFVEGPLAEQGAVPREAVVDVALEDGSIGVDLAKLEGMVTGAIEKSPSEPEPDEAVVPPESVESSDDVMTVEVEEIEDPEIGADPDAGVDADAEVENEVEIEAEDEASNN